MAEKTAGPFPAPRDVVQPAPDEQTDLIHDRPLRSLSDAAESALDTARRRFPPLPDAHRRYFGFTRTKREFSLFPESFPPGPFPLRAESGGVSFPGLAPEAWRVLVEQGRR
ncbi:MAG: hypothetical protein RMK65_03945, partial [Anaerolineae bacterium]|nr:hypothetical protein [Anaerolineae bacterium]